MDDLQNPSRRAMLGGIPAAALAATAIGASADDNGEVTRLLDIEARLIATIALLNAQYKISDECSRLSRKMAGKSLPPNNEMSVRENWYWWRHHRRWKLRHERMIDASGLEASNVRLNELREQRDEIADEVWSVKVTTMRAFKIKARMKDLTNYAAFSLAQDIIDLPLLEG